MSVEAACSELVELREIVRRASEVDRSDLDGDAALRAARFRMRAIERDDDASNLELSALPHGALQHSLLHVTREEDVEALAMRAEALPAFLAQHGDNLWRGAREERAPDREVVATFVAHVLPGATASTGELAVAVRAQAASVSLVLAPSLVERVEHAARAARDAYASFTRLVAGLQPVAREHVVLGEAETVLRLGDAMGLEASIDELLALAQESLERAHASLLEHAGVSTMDAAREVLLGVLASKPASIADAVALYERHLAAATALVRERALVPVPQSLALALEPLPAGIADGAALTNWPAPLCDLRGKGHALYATELDAHPIVQTKNLAVHEGIPGHYLQSACWQESAPPPVRFLGVSDHVAMSRGYFGTMLSVEGWAVHMEQLMLSEGFYDAGPERIFFAFCDAVRAMRVLLDLGIHAREMPEADAVDMITRATLMPEGWARAQVLRSKRIPLQSLTYLIGSTEIAALRAGPGRHLSALDFHRRLLAAGPLPPSRLGGAFA